MHYASPLLDEALAGAKHAPGAVAAHGADAGGHGADTHDAAHAAHNIAMGLSTVLGLLGICVGALFYFERRNGKALLNPAVVARAFRPIHTLLWNKYYLDELYHWMLVAPTIGLGWLTAIFDRGVIDGVVNFVGWCGKISGFIIEIVDRVAVDGWLVLGTARTTGLAGNRLSYAQTGRVRQYFVMTVVGICVISAICIWMF
jgi:NADH-quinone oxidoreductase subunit L